MNSGKGNGRKWIVNGVLAAGVVAVGLGAYATVGTSAASTGTVTNTATATKSNVLQTVSATGNVIAPTQAVANFAQAGMVIKIMAKLGDVVTAGQPIAQIDDSTEQAALTVAKNSLVATQASIDKANAGLAPADQSQISVSEQQAQNAVATAKANLSASYASAAQDAATQQAALDTADNALNAANTQLNTDKQTLVEDQQASASAQATSDPQAPAGEDTNQAILRYQQDQDACTAKNTPTDGVQCSDVGLLARLLQAVISQTKAVTSSTNAVTQAYNSVVSAQRNKAAAATKDSQAAASSQRSVDSANLSLLGTVSADNAKAASPTPDVLAQQATQLAQAQQAVAAAQKNEDETTLTAPIAGTIVALNGTIGLNTSGGSSSSASSASSASSSSSSSGFATIVDLTALQVRAGFAEADAAKLVIGQAATITFNALPNVTATAKVTEVDSLATVSSNVVTYLATLTLDTATAGVKPGMTATAAVVADHRDGVVSLPTSAVATRGNNAVVTVRAKDGKESQVAITIGLRGDQSVEITSGLKAGDIVVIRTAITGGGTSTRGGATGGAGGFGAGGFGGGGGAGAGLGVGG